MGLSSPGRRGRCQTLFGAAIISVAALALATAPAAKALSETPAKTFVTNGPVFAVLPTANATYIGGAFTRVGPRTGPGAAIDASTGRSKEWADIGAGAVTVSAPDGSGGFFVGGSFDSVGGVPRSNLAHILANGTVDPNFDPNPDAPVDALALAPGGLLYVGGDFTSIGGQGRNHVAALDVSTGDATGWNPDANGAVLALRVSGSRVYAGGEFTSIGGLTRNHIAALDATSGAAIPGWDPNATGGKGWVEALTLSGSTLYVGGRFTAIDDRPRNRIAALNASTGAATSWNPNANGPVHALSLSGSGSTVYAGGEFSSIGAQARNGLAAVNATTGAPTGWNPNPKRGQVRGRVFGLALSGSTVYAGGDFRTIGGKPRNSIAALDATSGAATGWDPDAGRDYVPAVLTVRVSGSTVYVGGNFTSIGGHVRNRIAALNPATGKLTGWNPNANGPVRALGASSSAVFAGGSFKSIGGKTRNRIAALNTTTGAATAWNPNANSTVFALAVPASGSPVYAGGEFTSIGGKSRNRIAALNTMGGAATAWNPSASDPVHALRVSGSIVYAGGPFTSIGDRLRNRIAALNRTTGAATAWNPNANGPVVALAVPSSGSPVYAGGYFSGIGGQTRRTIAALDPTSGAATSWNPNATGTLNGSVFTLAVPSSGSPVYAGGTFDTIGGQSRLSLAELDAVSGAATSWNPSVGPPSLGLVVNALALGPDGALWAGGNFTSVGDALQTNIAKFAP